MTGGRDDHRVLQARDGARARFTATVDRFAAAVGLTSLPRRTLLFTAVVIVLAAAAVVAGLLAPGGQFTTLARPARPTGPVPASGLIRLALAGVLVAAAQLARLRIRLGPGTVNIAWGEAALIGGLYLLPAGWLPVAVFAGTFVAVALLSVFSEQRTVLEVVHVAASLSLATALGGAAAHAIADPYAAELSPAVGVALAVAALVYLVVTTLLVSGSVAVRHRLPLRMLLARTLHGKALMFVGNVLAGVTMVALCQVEPRWLLLLPPAFWLLQQTYVHRLRADEERRSWQALARATRDMNQLDEHGVAVAGVRGALALFKADRAEIDVLRPDGTRCRYGADGPPGTDAEPTVTEGAADPDGADAVRRPLLVGGALVGELRVFLPFSVLPAARDDMALSAFGDALAAALHDAATHEQLRAVTARSSYEATHDPLTGLLNRAALLARGDALVRLLDREQPAVLVLLDINQFKEVNDTLGHAAGDELLKVVAERLRGPTRRGELLARLGGDEFALLVAVPKALSEAGGPARLPTTTSVLRRARQIADELAVPIEVAGVQLSVEASVGVVVAPAGSADMTELLRRAEVAMYQAKEGGGSVACYDSAKDAASTDQLALLAELREALTVSDQLRVALQPAVDLINGAPLGVEALIRWHHPRRGELLPAEFVRVVEGSELLAPFTRYVIDQALAAAAQWAVAGVPLPVSVNVSARSLLDPHLPAEVAESLRAHRVPPHRLVLEITETVVMSQLDIIDEVLAGLRALGVQLAVDDFGTGYSSLAFLTRVPVDELKVDREFVARMSDSPEAAAIVRTIVELARQLGLRVVAEGVETAEQRSALAELGCTAAQGYHFFRPMPAEKVIGVLRALRDAAPANILQLRADGAS